MIYVIGDLHLKHNKPYFEAQSKFLNYLQQYNDDILIFTGDIFDTSSPKWEVFSCFKEFLLQRKNKTFLLTGNHDYSKLKGNVLQPFGLLPNVTVIEKIMEIEIENKQFVFIPYLYDATYITNTTFHNVYVITHVTPVKYQFNDEGVKFTNIFNSYIFYGHYHIQKETYKDENGNFHYIVGVPYETRNGENQLHRILCIDTDKNIIPGLILPIFLQHIDIEYGSYPDLLQQDCTYILNVKNAPSFDAVYKLYADYNIRENGIELQKTLKQNEVYTEINTSFNQLNLFEKFSMFIKEKNIEIDKGVQELCLLLLSKIG